MRLDNLVHRAMGLALPHHFTADFYSAPIAHDIERARQQLGYSSRYEIPKIIGRTVSLAARAGAR